MINNPFGSSHDEEPKNETPCLLQNERGVCVLYKERYLYSKYDPAKAIKNIISNLSINPDTLLLIFSPALWHGLDDLILKLTDNFQIQNNGQIQFLRGCQIAAIEYDDNLFSFSKKSLNELNFSSEDNLSTEYSSTVNTNLLKEQFNKFKQSILFFNKTEINSYLNFINTSNFKKVIRIDFSGGTYFNRDQFENLYSVTQSIIDQNLKNKLTLIKFGRLFSKNIFKNLKHFDENTFLLQSFEKTIDKPILVLGAGESLDKTITALKKLNAADTDKSLNKSIKKTATPLSNFFILAVDQALTPLLENGIRPDAVVAVESQLAIEKAYIGKAVNSNIPMFADLVSRRHVTGITNGKKIFYLSDYSKSDFLKTLSEKNILPKIIRPLGSVGLVAIEIALLLRKNSDIPIYVSGLDFSYTPGITHAKGTVSHKRQLTLVSKLKSIFNFDSAFGTGTTYIKDKSDNKMITSVALSNYAKLFRDLYSDEKNLFDITTSGLDLGIFRKDLKAEIDSTLSDNITSQTLITSKDDINSKSGIPSTFRTCEFYDKLSNSQFTPDKLKLIFNYLEEEKLALETLKDILTYGDESKYRNAALKNSTLQNSESKSLSLEEQIDSLILPREYLYLHFPDTPQNTNRQSFLNRVRIETDFFLKELK